MRCLSRRAATPANRRCACREARAHRAGQSLEGAVHHRRFGRHRGRDQDRARRDRPLTRRSRSGMRSTAPGSGASALGGEALFRSGQQPRSMPGAEHVAPFAAIAAPMARRAPERAPKPARNMIDYVLEREGDVAASSPSRCARCRYFPPPGFWAEVRAICDRHGTLLIFDEIPTGLGKTGKCSPASTTASCPTSWCSARRSAAASCRSRRCIARPRLDVAGAWAFGHYTHEKNPVTARAALTTIEIIEEEELVENAARVGARARTAAGDEAAALPAIGDVRGRGLMLGIELVKRQVDEGAGRRPRSRGALSRTRSRALVQDDDGQCADIDAAAHGHRGRDDASARHCRARHCGGVMQALRAAANPFGERDLVPPGTPLPHAARRVLLLTL